MKVSLVTAVWGPWHVGAYLRVTLPTLLADQNLPALTRLHACKYFLFTTAISARQLEQAAAVARLREIMPLEIKVIAPDDSLSSDAHLSAWQQAIDEASIENSAIVTVHPDTPWSNGSFAFMGAALNEGKDVFIVPNVRAISETLVPALESLRVDEAIELSGSDISNLSLKHLHPLSAAMIPQLGYSAAATEIYWGVPRQGLCLRHASRPAIAAIPQKVPLDIEFYTRNITNWDGVLNVTDVNQMFMVSLAPLFKDFGLINPEHEVTPLLLGRWCAHPQNDTPLKELFAAQSLRLHGESPHNESAWQAAEQDADMFMDEVLVNMAAVNLLRVLRDQHCATAASVLALVLHETQIAKKLECPNMGQEAVVLAPNDAAFAKFGSDRLKSLLAPGNEVQLAELVLHHYRPHWSVTLARKAAAQAGVGVVETLSADRLHVLVIDQVLSEAF